MSLDENISQFIGRIYESAYDPVQWERMLLDSLKLFEARCILQTLANYKSFDMLETTVVGSPRRDDHLEEYQNWRYSDDASFNWAVQHPRARYCDTIPMAKSSEWLQDDFVRWNRDNALGSINWIVGYTAPGDTLVFALSVHPWSSALTEESKALFKMLFDHMERALRLTTHRTLTSPADDLTVTVEEHGQVVTSSQGAAELLAMQDGLSVCNGRLRASDPVSCARLEAVLRSALEVLQTGSAGASLAVSRPSGRPDLLLNVTPAPRRGAMSMFRPAAVVRVIVRDTPLPPGAPERWSQLFGLTAAETRLARAFLDGDQNLRRTAEQLGITYETARVHLKQVLGKTDSRNQAQLVRLLVSLSS